MLSKCSALSTSDAGVPRLAIRKGSDDGAGGIGRHSQAPRNGGRHRGHRSRDRGDDHRIHRLRARGGQRRRRAGEGDVRVGRLVRASGPRAGQDLVADRGFDRRTRRRVRPTRLAQHRNAVDAGAVADVDLFGVLPLLRRLVFEDQRRRLRREDRRHRDRQLRQHARLHAQRAVQRGGPDLPVERPDLQRQREARARLWRRAAACSSSRPRRRRCRRCCWTDSSTRPACPRVSSTC